MKPGRELERHLELVERLAMIAATFVHSEVARDAETMKQIDDEIGRRAALREPADEARLRVPRAAMKARPRRRALREDFTEEAKLAEARRRIFREEALGLGTEDDEVRIVVREELEAG